MSTVTLISVDDVTFTVDVKVASMSKVIGTMLDDMNLGDGNVESIPVGVVRGEVLERIIEWCDKHKDDPVINENTSRDISPWDTEFLKVNQLILFDLVLVAYSLDIKGLLNIACKAVKSLLTENTPEEIRKILNLTSDSSEEEEEGIER